jgi:hypothetical protein
MIRKDYILNQIEMLSRIGAKLILKDSGGQDSIIIFNGQEIGLNNNLNEELEILLAKRKINEAENHLFFMLEKDLNLVNLNTAITFYNSLVKMDKEILKENDFHQEEITEGFSQVCELYQIVDIVF